MILISAPIANATMELSLEAQKYLSFMFFVMSYFAIAQAVNTTLVVGTFRSGGDTKFGLVLDVGIPFRWGYKIRTCFGCGNNVGIFYYIGSCSSIYI